MVVKSESWLTPQQIWKQFHQTMWGFGIKGKLNPPLRLIARRCPDCDVVLRGAFQRVRNQLSEALPPFEPNSDMRPRGIIHALLEETP